MSALDDLRSVIELACNVEDRSDDEQRALLRVAVKTDNEANKLTVSNRRQGPAWRLHEIAESTRVLADDEKPISVADKDRAKLDRRADEWDEAHA